MSCHVQKREPPTVRAAVASGCSLRKMMSDVKIFEDPGNWKQNRLPCKADRIVFPDTISVIINSSVSAREIVLPNNGAIIFGENAMIELYEDAADVSCPGEDLLFTGDGSSHWEVTHSSLTFTRVLINVLVVVIVCILLYAVYLNKVRGITVNEMLTIVNGSVRQVSDRWSNFYIQRPVEGTFNFVRFQGDDDNIELEIGTPSVIPVTVCPSDTLNQSAGEDRRSPVPGKQVRSLRGMGYLMSDIAEVDEEAEAEEEKELHAGSEEKAADANVGDEKALLLLHDE